MMETGSDAKLYMVVRLNWDDHWSGEQKELRPGEGTPLCLFTSYAAAEAYCYEKENRQRGKVNPFAYPAPLAEAERRRLLEAYWARVRAGENPGSIVAARELPQDDIPRFSSLDGPRFYDWLGDIDIVMDPGSQSWTVEQWRRWWSKHKKKLSEYQVAKIWEALNRVHFHAIIELDPAEV